LHRAATVENVIRLASQTASARASPVPVHKTITANPILTIALPGPIMKVQPARALVPAAGPQIHAFAKSQDFTTE
jgi:hypothetical protein